MSLKAEDLAKAADFAKREAEREIRFAFQRSWGRFLKCNQCGGRPPRGREHTFRVDDSCTCSGTYRESGYSWKSL